MKLWVVVDNARWGSSHNVVRAPDEQRAAKLAGAPWPNPRVEITELLIDGPEGVLWCHDESPDTRDSD